MIPPVVVPSVRERRGDPAKNSRDARAATRGRPYETWIFLIPLQFREKLRKEPAAVALCPCADDAFLNRET